MKRVRTYNTKMQTVKQMVYYVFSIVCLFICFFLFLSLFVYFLFIFFIMVFLLLLHSRISLFYEYTVLQAHIHEAVNLGFCLHIPLHLDLHARSEG